MSTLTEIARDLIGRTRAERSCCEGAPIVALPAPQTSGGMPLMDALTRRHSTREFSPAELPPQVVSNLLWAAFGVNRRPGHERTAPSARDERDVELYVAMAGGLYLYDAVAHRLCRVAAMDARKVTGFQDFVDDAPMDLVFVAHHDPIGAQDEERRMIHSAVAAGAIAQNVYLYCASAGLATVVRGWFNPLALAQVLGLRDNEHVIVAQTVGYPAAAQPAGA